jgi:hypothetical protein
MHALRGVFMPSASLDGELASASERFFSPSVRLSINLASNALDARRDATFTWLFGQADVCPFRASVTPSLEVRPCAVAQGGVLRGLGRTAPDPLQASRAWLSAGGGGHVAWLVSPHAGIEVSGAAVLPFRQRDFVFVNPTRSIAHTVAPSWTLALGCFVAFP